MKKFLSLVLALVMTMSLVTVSAGAKDFTDDDKITYEEAVNVISTIGVVDGYADGSFNPQGTLTRGAAAKIICNMILGPTTAAELHADTAPYKDVPTNHTFAGYIAYCAKEGIISGYADGTFRPAGTLTGYAFMKMLLGALGYDAAIEGYTGANWSINVAKQALNVGLNKSLEGDFNGIKAVNREEAALYAFNTLKSDLVEYDTTISTTINGQTVTVGNSQAKAMTWNNSATRKTNIEDDDYVQFAEQYFTKLELEKTTDAFGRPSREWTFKGDEIGTYVNTDLLVESYTEKVTGKDLYDLLGKNTIADYDVDIYIDGETEEDVLNYTYKGKTNSVYFTAGNLVKGNDKKVGGTGDGVLTEVYVDTDAKEVTIAIINTYLAVANKDYDSKKEEVEFSIWGITESKKNQFVKNTKDTSVDLKASIEDFDVEDIEEDDVVLVNIADGEIQVITDPEVIEDTEITGFKNGSNLTTGGTKYKYADTACYDGEALVIYTSEDGATINLKDTTYNVILDPYGFVIGVEEVDPVDNFVFVTGYDGNTSNLSNKTADMAGIFMDGTMKVIEVDTKKSDDALFDGSIKNANGGSNHPGVINTWCSYTVNDDGVYTLKVVKALGAEKYSQYAQDAGSKTVEINKKHISLKSSASTYVYGNDDTVYLNVTLDNIANTQSGGKLVSIIDDVDSITTGVKSTDIEIVDVTATTADKNETAAVYPANEIYTLSKDNGFIVAAVVIGEDQGVSTNYAYVTSSKVNQEAYDKSTKEFTWSREVVIDGKLTEITYTDDSIDVINPSSAKNGKIDNKMDQGYWYKVSYYADGTVKSATALANKFLGDGTVEYLDDIKAIETAVELDKTLVYQETFGAGTSLEYKNGSLYVINTDKTGFSVSPDVKVVLCNADGNGDKFDEVDDEYTGYKGLEDAIDDLNANFVGDVSAIIEGGVATVIILNCTAKDPGFNPGQTTVSYTYDAVLVNDNGDLKLTVSTKDNSVVAAPVSFDVTVTSASLISDKTTSIETTGAIATGTNTVTLSLGKTNSMLSYQATVEIGNDTIVTGVVFG